MRETVILPKVKNNLVTSVHAASKWLLDNNGQAVPLDANNWDNVVKTTQDNLRFRQLPGEHNALGDTRTLELFPNRHMVYLHDTNARHLFERVTRASSAGWVFASQNSMELAQVILEQEGYFLHDDVLRIVGRDKTKRIKLENTVPVRTVYFTAEVKDDGTVHFFNDIYNRDGTLMAQRRRGLACARHTALTPHRRRARRSLRPGCANQGVSQVHASAA